MSPVRAPLQAALLRSALVRIDPVLVAALALVFGAAGVVAPLPALVTAGVALAALARQLGRAATCVVVVCAGLSLVRAQHALEQHTQAYGQALRLLPAPGRCAASARVSHSPVSLGGNLSVDAELSSLDCEGQLDTRRWAARLHVPSTAGVWLARGDELDIVADLAPTSLLRNFDLPDARPAAARRGAVLSGTTLAVEVRQRASGLRALVDRARAHVRERIEASFAAPVAALARALVLGESDLDPADELAFQKSGLSHLLAVSGTHLIVAVLALVRTLELVLRRVFWLAARLDVRRLAAWLGLGLAPLYADFAGGSGSAWRAAYMLCAVLGARACGRHVLPSRLLAASLVAGALLDPLLAFDISFVLSAAATAGLLAWGQGLGAPARGAALAKPRTPDLRRLAGAVSRASLTTVAASLPCVPLLLSLSPGLSLASLAANLLAAPLGEAVALPLCLLHAVSSAWPALERGAALVASGALLSIRGVAHAAASVAWLYVELPPPGPWHLGVLAAGGALLLGARARPWLTASPEAPSTPAPHPSAPHPSAPHPSAPHPSAPHPAARARGMLPLRLALIGLGLLLAEASARWPHSAAYGREQGRLRVSVLDVGQGDATLVDLPDGRLLLVDAGGAVGVPFDPGQRIILPTLRARRREHLDVVVLTHAHPDHMGGLDAVLRGTSVGELWLAAPQTTTAGSAYARLLELAHQQHIPVRGMAELCGAAALRGVGARLASTLAVLHPCPEPVASASLNDNSLVLRLQHGRHAALLVGDAENWAERRLLASHGAGLGADFLKVGHHGSRSSSSRDFLAAVAPRFAAISCGVRNRFGHPHPEALAALEHQGVAVYGLDRLGAVQWQSDGLHQHLRSVLPPEEDPGGPRISQATPQQRRSGPAPGANSHSGPAPGG